MPIFDALQLKRRAFFSFNPSGSAIAQFLYAIVLVVGGIWTAALAASLTYRSFLECRRESGVVVCELRKVYPGALTSKARFQLNSAEVEPTRFSLYKNPRSRSYELLVLNSELELPGSRDDPYDLASLLNDLLDGKASATGSIHLRDPVFGAAVLLACLAALLSAKGALMLWFSFREEAPQPSAKLRAGAQARIVASALRRPRALEVLEHPRPLRMPVG